MTDIIFIAGAPGTGKSTVTKELYTLLKSPFFEFSWIPEFRHKGEAEIPYLEEEQLSFENLTLVLKNYLKHGFKKILVTDLEDKRIQELHNLFSEHSYKIITLTINNDQELKERVLSEKRQNDYRDFEKAIAINRNILARPLFLNENRVDTSNKAPEDVVKEVMKLI